MNIEKNQKRLRIILSNLVTIQFKQINSKKISIATSEAPSMAKVLYKPTKIPKNQGI